MQLGFSYNGYLFVTFCQTVFQQSSDQTLSVLSLRAADKQSIGSPNELDTSLVNSQLIYFWQASERSLGKTGSRQKGAFIPK